MFSFFKKTKTEKINDQWLKSYHKKNPVSLTKRQSMQLEIEALQRLHKNYKCNCGNTHVNHFPIVKNINWDKLTITLTDCGETVLNIRERSRIYPDNFVMFSEQVKCIVDNLKRNNIQHLDIHRNNICIKNSVICLIDFDISIIDSNPLNEHIERRALLTMPPEREIKKMILL